MQVERKYFPDILPDNEEAYFQHCIGVMESVDELATLQISKLLTGYQFRLAPSIPKYTEFLIQEILKLHNMYKIHVDMSKSIKSTAIISFTVNLK